MLCQHHVLWQMVSRLRRSGPAGPEGAHMHTVHTNNETVPLRPPRLPAGGAMPKRWINIRPSFPGHRHGSPSGRACLNSKRTRSTVVIYQPGGPYLDRRAPPACKLHLKRTCFTKVARPGQRPRRAPTPKEQGPQCS